MSKIHTFHSLVVTHKSNADGAGLGVAEAKQKRRNSVHNHSLAGVVFRDEADEPALEFEECSEKLNFGVNACKFLIYLKNLCWKDLNFKSRENLSETKRFPKTKKTTYLVPEL
jgi:hypothetical protein